MATPLPILQNSTSNIFAYLWPDSKYVAINAERKLYIQVSQNLINNCKTLNKLRICKNTQPLRRISEKSACELKIATNLFYCIH